MYVLDSTIPTEIISTGFHLSITFSRECALEISVTVLRRISPAFNCSPQIEITDQCVKSFQSYNRMTLSLLLTLNRCNTLLWCFYYWLWTSKCQVTYSSIKSFEKEFLLFNCGKPFHNIKYSSGYCFHFLRCESWIVSSFNEICVKLKESKSLDRQAPVSEFCLFKNLENSKLQTLMILFEKLNKSPTWKLLDASDFAWLYNEHYRTLSNIIEHYRN